MLFSIYKYKYKYEMKICFIVISQYYYKAMYPLVVLRETPFCNKIDRKRVHGVEDFSASHTTNFFIYFTETE